jgi:Flp pilus assembly protein TadG
MKPHGRDLLRATGGQSLLEVALLIPTIVLLMGYAIDFGYFFIAAANISSAARNATQYSVQGYESPSQGVIPPAGPTTTATSVAATALADLTSLVNSGIAGTVTASTITTIQVCSKANGTSGNLATCTSYGATGTSYTPAADPEAPRFILQRVDITYTVQPPIPMSFFKVSLLPKMKFHRQVSMRAMD